MARHVLPYRFVGRRRRRRRGPPPRTASRGAPTGAPGASVCKRWGGGAGPHTGEEIYPYLDRRPLAEEVWQEVDPAAPPPPARAAVGGAWRSNPGPPPPPRSPILSEAGATGSAPPPRALAEGRPLAPPGGLTRSCQPRAGHPLRDEQLTRAGARLTSLRDHAGAPGRRGSAALSRLHVRAWGCPHEGVQRRLAGTVAQSQRVFTRAPHRPS